jgi:hypothetical protein
MLGVEIGFDDLPGGLDVGVFAPFDLFLFRDEDFFVVVVDDT